MKNLTSMVPKDQTSVLHERDPLRGTLLAVSHCKGKDDRMVITWVLRLPAHYTSIVVLAVQYWCSKLVSSMLLMSPAEGGERIALRGPDTSYIGSYYQVYLNS